MVSFDVDPDQFAELTKLAARVRLPSQAEIPVPELLSGLIELGNFNPEELKRFIMTKHLPPLPAQSSIEHLLTKNEVSPSSSPSPFQLQDTINNQTVANPSNTSASTLEYPVKPSYFAMIFAIIVISFFPIAFMGTNALDLWWVCVLVILFIIFVAWIIFRFHYRFTIIGFRPDGIYIWNAWRRRMEIIHKEDCTDLRLKLFNTITSTRKSAWVDYCLTLLIFKKNGWRNLRLDNYSANTEAAKFTQARQIQQYLETVWKVSVSIRKTQF
jgi:hypothetical protein